MRTRVRMTKLQQLQMCEQHCVESQWSYRALAEWAAEKLALPKPPGKSSVHRILLYKQTLASLSADCLDHKELCSDSLLLLDKAVVEFVVHAETSMVDLCDCF